MKKIIYIDRITKKREIEDVYGGYFIELLYGSRWKSLLFGKILKQLTVTTPLFSRWYGWCQSNKRSKKKVRPFIERFGIDANEFEKKTDAFTSFNDFFIRKLKKTARPITEGKNLLTMPADGRYLAIERIREEIPFLIKGNRFNLSELLHDTTLAKRYLGGTMVFCRLCPTDYHRFHFPCHCTPQPTSCINGTLFSVNPMALKKNARILTQNKRFITTLQTEQFNDILFIEIGATNVGSVIQTSQPYHPYAKGAEKGYFAFGASAIVMLFEPNTIKIDRDLLDASKEEIELRCLMGQQLGTITNNQ
ncbi:phosphatidylserine decarboxylase [Simkania negevensis]|uniref:phosphatidylserine decarboxylase n=1 Tax=Simkania negevensis TaxID=83561 RepID=A0ABS3ARP7_9BACT|nr:phosphatidylserine decarboxylase [Simkania negevensis]